MPPTPTPLWSGYTLLTVEFDTAAPTQRSPAPAVKRCECGSEAAGCGPGCHSDWCPLAAPQARS